MKKNKAFTLIELLVVIAVLAGFLALLVPNYMEVRKKSRDVRRKSDIRSIQKALELYKQSQAQPLYPAALTSCAALTFGGVDFMKVVPKDPLGSCSAAGNSYFYLPSSDFYTYTLSACLENTNDTDATTCPAAYAACTTKCYSLTEP